VCKTLKVGCANLRIAAKTGRTRCASGSKSSVEDWRIPSFIGTEVRSWSVMLQLLVVEIIMVFVVDELESAMLLWQFLLLALKKVSFGHTFLFEGIKRWKGSL
jgi:hypothetical protein